MIKHKGNNYILFYFDLDAARALNHAVDLYMEMGRLNMAARYCKVFLSSKVPVISNCYFSKLKKEFCKVKGEMALVYC
jgi:hypothetical protein